MDLRQLREVVGVTSDDVDVKGYADLISDSKLRGDDPDVVDDETEDAPRPVTDGGEDVCPTCGEDPEKSYRCQNCGADLVGKGTSSSSSRANLGDPQ